MELVRRVDRAGGLEQVERRARRTSRCLDDRLVLGRVLVGLEQDAIELLADRRGAGSGSELGGPGVDLQRDLALPLDAEQRRLDDLFRRLAKAPLAETAEVMRRAEQREEGGRLLGHVGLGAEVVARQLGEGELALGRELPGQVEVDVARDLLGRAEQRLGLGRGEAEQDVGSLDLAALAGSELDLQRGVGLAHHPAGVELAAVFEEGIHGAPIVT